MMKFSYLESTMNVKRKKNKLNKESMKGNKFREL